MRNPVRSFSFQLVLIILILFSSGCSVATHDCNCIATSEQKLITIKTLKASLPPHAIVSGFDIDDTVLFSTPGFYYGMTNTDGPGGQNKYDGDPLRNPLFWKDMNQEFDKFSIPKETGRALIDMHKQRGDAIFFITARNCTPEERAAIEKRMHALFALTDAKVQCTDGKPKTPYIEEDGIDIYYGDSDTDMEYSRAAKKKKVRPIRVQRSQLSTNTTSSYHPGAFGEEVIVHSEN